MIITGLYHTAIKTNDLAATVEFYTKVLGLREAPRPDFGYPGAWLAAPAPGGDPIIHIYAGGPALGADGKAPVGTAAMPTCARPPIDTSISRGALHRAHDAGHARERHPCGND